MAVWRSGNVGERFNEVTMWGLVNTGMGKPPQYFTKPPGPTQPPTVSGTGNEYQRNCGDALQLGVKTRMAHSASG